MEPSRELQTSWSCLHCGFAADYVQSRSPILERTIRDQRQSTQASSSSQDFTFFLQWDERDVFDGYCFHPLPNRTVDQIVDVSMSQRRRNLEMFSVVSDALISPDWSRPIHCTGRHHALVMGPCIWVLISYIQQGRQSHAHASSTTRSTLSCYSSEIPRVLSTSDEMTITQMRRTLAP